MKILKLLLIIGLLSPLAAFATDESDLMGLGLPGALATKIATGMEDGTFSDDLTVTDTATIGNGLTVTAGGATITAGGQTITAGGQTITAGGQTITAGGQTITAGGQLITAGGQRIVMTVTDNDAQNNTLTVAELVGGI
ncbi:MAG: hypothetical protein VKQ33_16395, partial [Candidatus Sericytochromatia bacterium]|nr:hypothetical protein [Candidatus Sericytochromatia bacterium]